MVFDLCQNIWRRAHNGRLTRLQRSLPCRQVTSVGNYLRQLGEKANRILRGISLTSPRLPPPSLCSFYLFSSFFAYGNPQIANFFYPLRLARLAIFCPQGQTPVFLRQRIQALRQQASLLPGELF